MESGTGVQVILDLILTIVKFMGRAAVQLQLLAIFLALFLAWYFSGPIVTWLGRLYGRWLSGQRTAVMVDGVRNVTDSPKIRSAVRLIRSLIQLADVAAFPLLAIAFLILGIVIFQFFGWFSGLLNDALGLLLLFLLYRLFVGFCYIWFDKQKVIYFQKRFFLPLFIVIIILLIVRGITDLPALAQAPLFPLFDGLITVGSLFLVTVGIYLWVMGINLLITLLQNSLTKRTNTDPRALEAWLILLRYFLVAMAVIFAFQLIGFNTTTLAAVLGGLSVGIGFALQDVLRNFLGGIILLFEGSVRPGDWIKVGDTIGKVENLRIRSTVVRTGKNIENIIPNQNYLNSTIVSYTYNKPGLWLVVPVKVANDNNVRQVQEVLVNTAERFEGVHPDPPPVATLVDFNSGTLTFELSVWILDIKDKKSSEADLRVMILEALQEEGIKLA